MLFGWLGVGQVMATNPAAPVREQWYPVKKGQTPVLTHDEARELMEKIARNTHVWGSFVSNMISALEKY